MTDIKMSDVFGKEVHFDAYNGTLVDPVDYGEWAEFNSEDALVAATHAINSHDSLVEQLATANEEIAALKTYASKGDEEIEKLSLLVEIVSNQKQRIQQLEQQLAMSKMEITEYREILSKLSALIKPISSSASEYIDSTLAKHEELK